MTHGSSTFRRRRRVAQFPHLKAFTFAAAHYALSLGIGFMTFATAWGLGLSDSYQSDAPLKFFTVLLIAMQAPTVLFLWIAHLSGLVSKPWGFSSLALLGTISSLLYGYTLAHFSRKKRSV